MTSVAMRILGATTEPEKYTYESHAALRDEGTPTLPAGVPVGGPAGVGTPTPLPAGGPMGAPMPDPAPRGARGRREPARALADTAAPGNEPIAETEQAPTKRPAAPRAAKRVLGPEVAVAPQNSSPILDVLQATGWKVPVEATDG